MAAAGAALIPGGQGDLHSCEHPKTTSCLGQLSSCAGLAEAPAHLKKSSVRSCTPASALSIAPSPVTQAAAAAVDALLSCCPLCTAHAAAGGSKGRALVSVSDKTGLEELAKVGLGDVSLMQGPAHSAPLCREPELQGLSCAGVFAIPQILIQPRRPGRQSPADKSLFLTTPPALHVVTPTNYRAWQQLATSWCQPAAAPRQLRQPVWRSARWRTSLASLKCWTVSR
jgi:hypothetical protein